MQKTIKEYLKRQAWFRPFRLARMAYRARTTGYPNWKRLIGTDAAEWEAARRASIGGPRVLVATSVGAHLAATTLESLLCVALTLRGAEVHILLCDAALPACMACVVDWYPRQERFVEHGPANDLCRHCFPPAYAMYRSLGLPVHRYSELVTPEERPEATRIVAEVPVAEVKDFKLDGIAVGEHAMAGALRFFARGSLDSEPHGEAVLRRYLRAALLTTYAIQRLLRKVDFSCLAFHHGIYVPQGLIGEVARREKVRVVNWNPSYRKRTFIFSHDNSYHHTLMWEPGSAWENIKWTSELEADLMAYLKTRWTGSEDWIWFHQHPEFDTDAIAREIGADFSKPCVGLLTNVVWDAQLHYPANTFPNMLDWLIRTIDYFSRRPGLQLLVRIHPAEIYGDLPSRQRAVDEIREAFPVLPKNVFVIPPESRVSTHAAMSKCNAVIIYGTKTGVELTSIGIPVIVAGESWIRNKGVTMDANTADEYFRLLDCLPLGNPVDPATLERARKYAYHFFFRRMIPLEVMEPTKGWPPYRIRLEGLEALRPGRSVGLDVICEGILNGSDFIYPAERLNQSGSGIRA